MENFLSVSGITKEFPGVRALNEVSLDIAPGEVLALTGENGSGKSTLAKIIGGLYQQDVGEVYVEGALKKFSSPSDALELGIVLISQELTLAPDLTVTENILLGRLPLRRGRVDWTLARERAQSVLDRLGVDIDPDSKVQDLSVESQQEVEIARAMSNNARLLILDEATSSLSESATEKLLNVVRELSASGVAVLMITHRMPEIYATCHRAVVLRDGHFIGSVRLPETPESEVVRMMVGRELADYFGSRTVTPGAPVLEVSEIASEDGKLQPVSFTVRAGEIFGVAGLVGSGKAELAMALGGAIRSEGKVVVNGREVSVNTPKSAIAAGIGYVPDDRRQAAILPTRSVGENIALALSRKITTYGLLRRNVENRLIESVIGAYGVKTSSPHKKITLLSGGNQQKAILGRTFARESPVYVLNEPTRGVDVGSKSSIYDYLQRLAEGGAAIIIVSSELPELMGLADRIAVCFEGSIRGVLEGADISEASLAALAVSGELVK